MIEKTMSGLEELFVNYTPRRLLYILFLLSMVIVLAFVFEYTTGFFFMWNMERKLALLKELKDVSGPEISADPQLNEAYRDIVSKLNVYRFEPLGFPNIQEAGAWGLKFMTASWLWLGVAFYGILTKAPVPNRAAIVIFAFILVVVFGLIGVAIPNFGTAWVNIIAYILVWALIFAAFSRRKA
jgi:hypothetical protein